MRKTILTLLALAVMVVSYESMALGASAPTRARGEIRFMGGPRCDLRFVFSGLQPGAKGRLKVTSDGSVHIVIFHVGSESGHLNFRLVNFLGMPGHPVQVQYGIAVQGMDHVVTGETTMTCNCGPGSGGSGGSGGTGGSTPSAGAASAVSSTPGFAG